MSGSSAQTRPILSVKIRPLDGDIRRLYNALGLVIQHDPNVRVVLDPDSQQVSVLCTDEAQLERVTVHIRRKSGIAIEASEPEIIYLESIRGTAESESKYIRQTGGSGNYAHVRLRIEAIDPDRGVEFVGAAKTVPSDFIPAVEQGVREAAMRGIQDGREITGVRVILYDGSYHETDSNEMAFRTAGSAAFAEAIANAGRVLLEPIMAVEVTVPQEYAEIVKRDLANRRGRVADLEQCNNSAVVRAVVPLAEMLGYRKGSSEITMHFLRYVEARLPEEYGEGEARVIARTPRGPKPKQGFTSLPEPE